MKIRQYQESDHCEIADLFYGAVHAVDERLYPRAQLDAWAPWPPDYQGWRARLEKTRPFVAVEEGRIIGFVELEEDGHIDCFYVHKCHQRRGVAKALFAHLSREAGRRGIKSLHVEASKAAKPFFEGLGFETMAENVVERRGQNLVNYKMVGQPAR